MKKTKKKGFMGWFQGNHSWKRWTWKLFKNCVFVFLAGLASYYGDSVWYLGLAPALSGLENWLKHK